jgi:hypothetical protein
MFLTETQFLDYFKNKDEDSSAQTHEIMSRSEFVDKLVVTYSGNPTLANLFDLQCPRVIKTSDDFRILNKDKIIDYLYDITIVNRNKYLSEFYNRYYTFANPFTLMWDDTGHVFTRSQTSFPIDSCEQIRIQYNADNSPESFDKMYAYFDAVVDDSQYLHGLSVQKNDEARRMIRNLNYLDLLHLTQITNSVKCKVSFWQTFINLYNHLRLEDRLFCKSCLEVCLKAGDSNTFFYHIQQYQPKASVLNPYVVNYILKNEFQPSPYLHSPSIEKISIKMKYDGFDINLDPVTNPIQQFNGRLFTPVLSWGSYLMAFMHTQWSHYVGVDVMKTVCDRAQFLFDYYQSISFDPTKKLDLYCQPSESLLHDDAFLDKYQNYFDSSIMCSPYYNMEIYPSGEQ